MQRIVYRSAIPSRTLDAARQSSSGPLSEYQPGRGKGRVAIYGRGVTVSLRLIGPADAPSLTQLLLQNRAFLAPWEPEQDESFFTAAGQGSRIELSLSRYEAGSMVPYVILAGAEIVGRSASVRSSAALTSLASSATGSVRHTWKGNRQFRCRDDDPPGLHRPRSAPAAGRHTGAPRRLATRAHSERLHAYRLGAGVLADQRAVARQPALSTTQPVTVLTCRHVRGTLLRGVGDGIGEHLGRGTPATVSVVDEDERSAQDSARPVVDAGGALGKVVLVAQGAGIGLRTRTHTHRGRSGRFRPSRRDASLPPSA